MHKNQLQELAQRSCFNLPSYSCIREGPDHAPRFKATVNFNGETFESPAFCSTLRLAEHTAAEVALNTLAQRGPSRVLATRVLDETGVYKNLLQETAHRAGLNLPVYTTVRSGPGHVPLYSCTVELAGISFSGEPARTKKQAQKNAAMAAWSALRKLPRHESSSSTSSSTPVENKGNEEQEQDIVARVLASLQPSESKTSTENDRRDRHQKSSPVCFTSTPPTPNLYALRFQNWACSNFPPELAMYQIYQQEQLFQQQYRLLALTVPPTIPSVPQIYPFMHSMHQPDHRIYFSNEHKSLLPEPKLSIASPNPSLCFSNDLGPNGVSRSGVTIREIEEEKSKESSVFTPSRVPDLVLGNTGTATETRNQELVPDSDKQKIGETCSKIENAHLQGNPIGQLERTIRARHSKSKASDFPLPNPRCNDSSQPSIQPQYPHQGSYCVMIRTVRPSSSSGPRLQSITPVANPPMMRTGAPPYRAGHGRASFNLRGRLPTSISPAVQIRSVVPVCSAPPARKVASSAQEGVSPNSEKKYTESEDLSRANDDFYKLRI